MIRLILSLGLLCSFIHASVIKNVEVMELTNKDTKIEDVMGSKEFKRTKLPFIRHSSKSYIMRLTFDKKALGDASYSIELENEFNVISLQKDIPFINIYKNKVFNLSSDNFIQTLYLKVHNIEQYVNFDVGVYETNDYAAKELLLSKLFGVAYGIIFAAFLYYFALYLFNREKTYIYYSLTQLSMLAILLFISYKELENDQLFMDLIFFFFFLFSNLFTKSFLNTKVNTPRVNFILTVTIYIYIADLLGGWMTDVHFFEDNFPLSFLLIFYLIAGVLVYKQGHKPALFYLIGWGVVIFTFLFVESQFYFTEEPIFIKPLYIIHITTPLESLILAFALSYKMKILEEEKEQQQQFLTHQSKLASMGEMIGNIAHQWRQPLTHLSYIMMNLKTAFEKEKLTKEYFENKTKEATEQLEFMSHTITDFSDFFKVSKKKEEFSLNHCLEEVVNLLSASFKSHEIEVKLNMQSEFFIHSFKGELLQVFFNILNNAKDEFVKNKIKSATININVIEERKRLYVKFLDNAGGIPSSIAQKVFEPYFTTKEKGLGIGLYMSKMIIEKNIGGKLSLESFDHQAEFVVELPYEKQIN